MPASKHPAFIQPDDKAVTIWRYMDFTKYVSMLSNRGLYLCRADRLEDRFEGSVSQATLDAEQDFLSRGLPGLSQERIAGIMNSQSDIRQFMKKITYINCWHMGSAESAAMWRLYAKSDDAVAILSKFSTLFNCLPRNYLVGLVRYIDYRTDPIGSRNFLVPFLHKRQSFQHENEFRVLRLNPPEGDGSDYFKRETPEGIWVSVDLAQLISRVHVSPESPTWFRELVESVSRKYGYDFTVHRSDLDKDPIF